MLEEALGRRIFRSGAFSVSARWQGHPFDPASGNTANATFTSANVRHVKLTFTANAGWPAGQFSESEVFAS